MDLSTFAKFEVTGPDADAFLERICANRIPRSRWRRHPRPSPERQWLHRERDDSHAPGRGQVLCALRRRASSTTWTSCAGAWRRASSVTITDVTDGLWRAGPGRTEVPAMVLARCTDRSFQRGFRWLTAQARSTVAGVAGVRALRVNYVGELGWELHVPMAGMPKVFDALMAAGEPHGITLVRHLCDEQPAHGEGLSRLGRGTDQRGHPGRCRHGALHRLRQGLHRQAAHAARSNSTARRSGWSIWRSMQPTTIATATSPSITATGSSASPPVAPTAIAVEPVARLRLCRAGAGTAGPELRDPDDGGSPQGDRAFRPAWDPTE